MPTIKIQNGIKEESIKYWWGVPLEKKQLDMLYSIYFKQENAHDKTREFFTSFFRVNPTLGNAIKGIED